MAMLTLNTEIAEILFYPDSLAGLKKSSQSATPAANYLYHCGTGFWRNIKQTARHCGPDLSSLKRCTLATFSLFSVLTNF